MAWGPYSKHQLWDSLMVSLLSIKSVFHFNHCHLGQVCLLLPEQSPDSSGCHIRSFTILSMSNSFSLPSFFPRYYNHNAFQFHVIFASCDFLNIPNIFCLSELASCCLGHLEHSTSIPTSVNILSIMWAHLC